MQQGPEEMLSKMISLNFVHKICCIHILCFQKAFLLNGRRNVHSSKVYSANNLFSFSKTWQKCNRVAYFLKEGSMAMHKTHNVRGVT